MGDPGNDHPAVRCACARPSYCAGHPASASFRRDLLSRHVFDGDRADEILTEIRIPFPAAGTGWSYAKLKRKTGDFATAATAVLLQLSGNSVQNVSITLTNLGPRRCGRPGRSNICVAAPLTKPL